MTRCLIVYASTDRRAEQIARRIAGNLRTIGVRVDLRTTSNAEAINVHDFDVAIVGVSVDLVDWVAQHAITLREMPSACFSAAEAESDIIEAFMDDTGWTPTVHQAFAGALQWGAVDALAFQIADLLPVPAPS
jgi:menaquinone-dependent protoporphyrinogen IX oxidase